MKSDKVGSYLPEKLKVSEEELDNILKKIKVAGYDALSDEEKDKLFKA